MSAPEELDEHYIKGTLRKIEFVTAYATPEDPENQRETPVARILVDVISKITVSKAGEPKHGFIPIKNAVSELDRCGATIDSSTARDLVIGDVVEFVTPPLSAFIPYCGSFKKLAPKYIDDDSPVEKSIQHFTEAETEFANRIDETRAQMLARLEALMLEKSKPLPWYKKLFSTVFNSLRGIPQGAQESFVYFYELHDLIQLADEANSECIIFDAKLERLVDEALTRFNEDQYRYGKARNRIDFSATEEAPSAAFSASGQDLNAERLALDVFMDGKVDVFLSDDNEAADSVMHEEDIAMPIKSELSLLTFRSILLELDRHKDEDGKIELNTRSGIKVLEPSVGEGAIRLHLELKISNKGDSVNG